jgi:DNA-binding transcriptional regulator PaaX
MWVITMARGDWSMADELGWREAAWRWFLARGVKANLAEDLTQEQKTYPFNERALLRLLRGQQRVQQAGIKRKAEKTQNR